MDNQVTVEISARHVHLSQADLETLFGKGYELTVKKMLSQHGEFIDKNGTLFMGTYHPAAILRNPNNKEAAFGDWLKVRDKIQELHLNV